MMEIREAARLLKAAAQTAEATIKIAEAASLLEAGEAKISGLMKQKESLDADIKARRDELSRESARIAQALKDKHEDAEQQEIQMNDALTSLRASVNAAQQQLNETLNKARTEQKAVTSAMVTERNTQITALDKQIAAKRKQFDEISGELAKVREKVGI